MNTQTEWQNISQKDNFEQYMSVYPEITLRDVMVVTSTDGGGTNDGGKPYTLSGWRISKHFALVYIPCDVGAVPSMAAVHIATGHMLVGDIYFPQAVCETIHIVESFAKWDKPLDDIFEATVEGILAGHTTAAYIENMGAFQRLHNARIAMDMTVAGVGKKIPNADKVLAAIKLLQKVREAEMR